MPFYAEICFSRRFLVVGFPVSLLDNYANTNKDASILSATKMFVMDIVSEDIKIYADIR